MLDFYDLIEVLFGAVWNIVKQPIILPSPVGQTSIMNIGIFFGLLGLMVYAIQRFFGFVNDEYETESDEEAFEREVEEASHRMDVSDVARNRRRRGYRN